MISVCIRVSQVIDCIIRISLFTELFNRHRSLEVFFFLVVMVVVNYFSETFRYITGNSKCAIQTFVYKPLYVLTLRQDKGRGIRRINPSTAIILLCLPIEKFGVSFQKTPEIEYRNVTKII